jgi:hypothetical protein
VREYLEKCTNVYFSHSCVFSIAFKNLLSLFSVSVICYVRMRTETA